jgi:hypothetical protein
MGISEPRDRLSPARLQTMKAARIHQLGSPDVIAVESIPPDMQISRIRLSDKTSRLHPRHVPSDEDVRVR